MSLSTGTHLGPYEIMGAIGAGGMGEVFRARDTKLNRDVAIKVLPAEFAQDHERVARFKREAQVLASLNHPKGDAAHGWTPGKPAAFLATPAVELYAMFSPDGRWIAYASNDTGAFDVHVRPFPGPGGPWRISTGGGSFPRWSST